MIPKPWSYSVLQSLIGCSKRYYEIKIAKNFEEDYGDEAKYGLYVHGAIENALKGQQLPNDLHRYQHYVEQIKRLAQGRVMKVEMKLAITKERSPCSFFAKACWTRCVIDVFIMLGEQAILLDHKTGKKKATKQLLHNALLVFENYPHIKNIQCIFYWLQTNKKTVENYSRDNLEFLWSQFDDELQIYNTTFETEIFNANPSGLCKGWCPVKTCEHWQPKAKP